VQKPLISAHFINDVHLFCNAAIVDQDEPQKKNILGLKDSVTGKTTGLITRKLIRDIGESHTSLTYRSASSSKLSASSALHGKDRFKKLSF
jgi:hypothetical protein